MYIVHNFLSPGECDRLLAKVSGQLVSSSAAGVTRSSQHVRPIKSETTGLHARVAHLMGGRRIENMETCKIIRYKEGQEFQKHFDAQALNASDAMGCATLDGSPAPSHLNRE